MKMHLGNRWVAFTLSIYLATVATCNAASLRTNPETYIKAVYSLPLTLDPVQMHDTASLVAGNLIYDGLLRFSPTLKLEGALAETWSTSPDGKTLTFVLRKDAKFHNGDAVTANDVVVSLKRALSQESQVKKYYDCIEGAESANLDSDRLGLRALDQRTISIRLKHPFPPILSILAGATAKVLPRKLVTDPKFFEHPVGSGAYKYISRSENKLKEIELARFDDYYRGASKIKTFILRALDEADATRAASSGEIDDLANWPLTATDPVFKSGKNISSPLAATWIIGLNVRTKPFESADVRRLFKRDVDTEGFRRKFYPDAISAAGYVPPGLPGHIRVAETAMPSKTRPAKEKIKIVIPKELNHFEEMKTFLEGNLRSKGWSVEVVAMEWSELMKGYSNKTHQAFLVSMNLDYPDAEFMLRNFESTNPDNFSGLHDPKLDRLVLDARTLQDRRKREGLYRQAISILNDEAVTVNLFHPRANYWISECVEGFKPNILADVYIDYAKVSLKSDCSRQVAIK